MAEVSKIMHRVDKANKGNSPLFKITQGVKISQVLVTDSEQTKGRPSHSM